MGALGGIIGAIRPSPTVIQRTAASTPQPPAGLAGVAELAVRDWLTTDDLNGEQRTKVPDNVGSVATVAVRQMAPGYWAVTVGAALRLADGEGTTWFLEVGVADGPQGPHPVGNPAPVPPPISLTSAEPAGLALAIPQPGDPVAATVEAFLRALLTGSGDPVRYVAPQADIGAMASPPFTEMRLDRLAFVERSDRRADVRVAITAKAAVREFAITYELSLQERDGRWEITDLAGAPRRPSTATTSSTTTSTAATPASPGA